MIPSRKNESICLQLDLFGNPKVIVLRRLLDLSNYQLQLSLLDRWSFQRFLWLGVPGRGPDENTIWSFRETLTQWGIGECLFDSFQIPLRQRRRLTNRGSLIDDVFIEVPRRRNTREENRKIEAGEPPSDWPAARGEQNAAGARWTKKGEVSYFEYKDHVNVDSVSKLITYSDVNDAAVNDSPVHPNLVEIRDAHHDVHADGAREGQRVERALRRRRSRSRIHEKRHRNHPLTEKQKENTRKKSTVRARIEHVFECRSNTMGGLKTRSTGITRARAYVGMIHLPYNVLRCSFLPEAWSVQRRSKKQKNEEME